jgi:hypothetical protein
MYKILICDFNQSEKMLIIGYPHPVSMVEHKIYVKPPTSRNE